MAGERTEEATPKKLREARRRGEAPKSRELASASILVGGLIALTFLAADFVETFRSLVDTSIHAIGNDEAPTAVLEASANVGLRALAPLLVTLFVISAFAGFVQVGPMFSPRALAMDMTRLDPFKGLTKLISRRQWIELLKNLAKLALMGGVAAVTLRDAAHGVGGLAGRDAATGLSAMGAIARALLLRVGLVMLAMAVLDVVYQRWQFRRDQRMTKDEVKREHKESEGDPHTKADRERMRREILTHSVLERARVADVLVVNPTHLAVALKYDDADDDSVPEVLAKGEDELAQRMIAAAREAGVPIMRDIPLARALYEMSEGDGIPEELYEAVAAVLHAAWAEREAEESK